MAGTREWADAYLAQARADLAGARAMGGASASRMLLVLRRQRGILEPLGGTIVWEDVLSTIYNLERAHPALAPEAGPQMEYPWEDVHGNVRWPARDLAIASAKGDASNMLGPRVLRFAEQLGRHFDSMFA